MRRTRTKVQMDRTKIKIENTQNGTNSQNSQNGNILFFLQKSYACLSFMLEHNVHIMLKTNRWG